MNRPITPPTATNAPAAAKRSVSSVLHCATMDSGAVMTVEPDGWLDEKLPVHPANLWNTRGPPDEVSLTE
jgi:hypothetical protein